jgi:type II secretory pathway component GspD/PulD (secretin)
MDQEMFVKSGETIIASGFVSSQEVETLQRLPILSNLPLIGNMFRSKSKTKKDKEVIFMITPTIIPMPM